MESDPKPEKLEIPWMQSLVPCVNRMKEEGYTDDFQVTDEGLSTFNDSKIYSPAQIRVVSFYRFEGESDPGDSSILYVVETDDGRKGTLVDGYGAYAGGDVSRFIVDVERIQKVKITDLDA